MSFVPEYLRGCVLSAVPATVDTPKSEITPKYLQRETRLLSSNENKRLGTAIRVSATKNIRIFRIIKFLIYAQLLMATLKNVLALKM